jgi:hypothetical protein
MAGDSVLSFAGPPAKLPVEFCGNPAKQGYLMCGLAGLAMTSVLAILSAFVGFFEPYGAGRLRITPVRSGVRVPRSPLDVTGFRRSILRLLTDGRECGQKDPDLRGNLPRKWEPRSCLDVGSRPFLPPSQAARARSCHAERRTRPTPGLLARPERHGRIARRVYPRHQLMGGRRPAAGREGQGAGPDDQRVALGVLASCGASLPAHDGTSTS